ncbi:MAG: hypothetical protein LBQ95_03825 [Lachnospiraceae bacterium]|jgi:hypothetical protein|nr:hypothetical protein [Lachnospiraceae bacterium]
MACFIVPATEAIVTTIVKKTADSNEKEVKIPFTRKLKWLNNMLWGGSALLAFEHIWHGEVTPWFPFLTAAQSSSETAAMLHEMATRGVAMAVLVTLVWLGMVAVTGAREKKEQKVIADNNDAEA